MVVIDADLQDPPELIPALVAQLARRLRHGLRARAAARAGETLAEARAPRTPFYRADAAHRATCSCRADTGDFRLMSRRVVDAVRQLREQPSLHEGPVRLGRLPHDVRARTTARRASGRHSKWNYWQLWNLALEGITSFTVMPLKLATYLGLVVAAAGGGLCAAGDRARR